jgi:hypothetical protein
MKPRGIHLVEKKKEKGNERRNLLFRFVAMKTTRLL